MANKSSSLTWPVLLAIVGLILFSKVTCKQEPESSEHRTTSTVSHDRRDPTITRQVLSGSDADAVVIRSGDCEYVRVNGLVFCWRGTNLMGVFNEKGAVPVWEAMTNHVTRPTE